jgi:hypothetical protein
MLKSTVAACGILLLCAAPAAAQTPPGLYSTKPNPEPPLAAPAKTPFGMQHPDAAPPPMNNSGLTAMPTAVPDSPQQRFVPTIPADTPGLLTGGNAPAGATPGAPLTPNRYQPTVPFGRASAEALAPVPVGPRTTVAAPVENIDAGEVGIADPAEVTSEDLPPAAVQDPTATTPQSGAVFAEEPVDIGPREMILRGLNKVTAQEQEIRVVVGDTVRFGQLEITPRACRNSTPESQPESAALVEVAELPPGVDAPEEGKPVFNGWMFASSPSLSGLEHPVYDVSVVGCGEAKEVAATQAKPAE